MSFILPRRTGSYERPGQLLAPRSVDRAAMSAQGSYKRPEGLIGQLQAPRAAKSAQRFCKRPQGSSYLIFSMLESCASHITAVTLPVHSQPSLNDKFIILKINLSKRTA